MFCAALSLTITYAEVGLAMVVLIRMEKCPSAITIRGFWKSKHYLQELEIAQHTWGHTPSEVSGSERARAVGLGFCFYGDQGGGLGFCGLTLCW